MRRSPLLRAGAYLFISLCGMIAGGYFSSPYAELIHLACVLFILFAESRLREERDTVTVVKSSHAAILLFPPFFALTLGTNLAFANLTLLLGGEVPTVTPSLPLFLGAVLLAPVAEELLFRHILISIFSPFGKGKAILLSALFFALAHGNFFQMPYAFVAGCLLGLTATVGKNVLYPVLFHVLYNLAAFLGNADTNLVLLLSFGILSLPAICLLFRHPLPKSTSSQKLPLREGTLLLLYGGVMLLFSVFRLL